MSLNELVEKSELEGQMDELQPGTTLLHGQYTITRFLNNGGFGITYLAKDSLDREVVIKECFADAFCRRTNTIVSARSRAHQGELKSIIRHFIQEARSLSKLMHPNIVGVHQVFEDNDTAYMAIDFVDGKDLLEILEDPAAKLTPEQIVGITRKLLSAIGYVHEHGLLHRDISPDNILLTRQGEPILIDFGAARENAGDTGRKHSALRVVKDGYSPQEFYIAGSEQGPWSDLYALAASLYHAIKSEAPVNGQQRLAAIAEQRPDPYEPLTGAVEGYPAGFLEAVDKAMNTKPSMRIQSSTEWLALLDNPAGKKTVDGDPEAAISKLLVQSDDDSTLDSAVAAAAVADVAGGKKGGFAPLADADPQPMVETPAKGRGGLMAVSALAVLAVLGLVGYSFVGGEAPAPTEAEVAQPVAAVEPVTEPAPAPAEQSDVVVATAAPSFGATDDAAAAPAEVEETADITASAEAPVEIAVPAVIAEPVVEAPAADEIVSEEAKAPAPAIVKAEPVADGPVLEQQVTFALWDIAIPFEFSQNAVRNAQVVLITDVPADTDLAVAGSWIAPGTEIFTVNDEPFSVERPFTTLVLNAMVIDPDGYTRTTVRFKSVQTQR
ncbi:MAG: protein kinase, partial [Albidovulum sp.]|uniref:serine/threonine protein kinase n=1 Tax=Albidovulum sp. TaxID=1872424 RepID=UPI003C8D4C30